MTTFRGFMPDPGGKADEDAIVMGMTELGATEAQVRFALPFILAQYIDLMASGRTIQARALLAQALADHPS